MRLRRKLPAPTVRRRRPLQRRTTEQQWRSGSLLPSSTGFHAVEHEIRDSDSCRYDADERETERKPRRRRSEESRPAPVVRHLANFLLGVPKLASLPDLLIQRRAVAARHPDTDEKGRQRQAAREPDHSAQQVGPRAVHPILETAQIRQRHSLFKCRHPLTMLNLAA